MKPYLNYPTGHLSIDRVYQVIAPNRKQLRSCHQEYLFHIPGAFDTLALQFQIDPDGKAIPFATHAAQKPKNDAIDCIKSIIASITFPKPEMGIVFVVFESDLQDYNVTDLQKQPLSRNAVRLVPLMPQKMVRAMIEMYMPYYKQCFLRAPKEKRPMTIGLSWTINTNGLNENIIAAATPAHAQTTECILKVTQEHRYPTGYAPTEISAISMSNSAALRQQVVSH
ncbi:MAG: AgmX/PglI C-terminal domain-containing protein [Bdellovibrionota bacterium]